MISKVYCVYDIKAGTYGAPVLAMNDAEATRMFLGACRVPGSMLHDYARDFSLMCMGTFDVSSGKFDCLEVGRFVVNGSESLKLIEEDSSEEVEEECEVIDG